MYNKTYTKKRVVLSPFRNTFGVIDKKTGKIYPDLKNFFIKEVRMDNTYPDEVEYLARRDREGNVVEYKLLMDYKLKQELKSLPDGEGRKVIVSFQERFNGQHTAVARLYRRNV